MLKLKLQYFGHLMWRTDSFEKSLMLGMTEGGRRRGRQRMRWLDGITDSMDSNGVWVNSWNWWWPGRPGVLQSMRLQRVRHNWAIELTDWVINFPFSWVSLVAQMVKNLPSIWEIQVQPLGWDDPVEKEMATHSSILAWRIPWTEELVGSSPWGQKELNMTNSNAFTFHFLWNVKCSLPYFMPRFWNLGFYVYILA